jgi:NTE family protein
MRLLHADHVARRKYVTTMPPLQDARVDGWDAIGRSTSLPHPAPHSRRQIGIALGAGAARGWSHIGVLQELAEHGIHPDIVAGTSIGAVVGGCYASGKLAEIEAFARSLTTKAVLSLMDVSFSGVGILTGRKLRERLEETIGSRTFADLDKAFGVVATECGSGNEVWVTKGDVARAVRASYALPGIFEPVNIWVPTS